MDPGRGRRPGAAARRGVLYILVGALAVLVVLSLQRQSMADVIRSAPLDSTTNATLHLLQEQVEEIKRLVAAQREDAKKEFQNLHSGLQQAQKGSSQDQLEENKRLEALVQKYRQEQVVFCKELAAGNPNPGGTPANDTYIRKAGIQAAHNAGFTFPMWVLAGSDIVSNEVNFNGQWEGTETLFILDRLKEWKEMHIMDTSDVVLLDVGANIGWFAINAAALGYTVFAFEPMAKNIGAICRTLCDNPDLQSRLTLITTGLSHKAGKCSFYVHTTNKGNGVTVCEGSETSAELTKDTNYEKVGEFELATLDGLFEGAMGALQGRVPAMKIDVEGFEPHVYAGGRQFMNAVQPKYIMAELNRQYPGLQASLSVLKLYDEMNYRIHSTSFHGEVLDPLSFERLAQERFGPGTNTNIYLVRRPS